MRRVLVAAGLAALLCASCTITPTTRPKSTGVTSTSTTSAPHRPSALDNLTAYFTAAAEIDQKLKAAAADANRAIGTTQITISPSTLDAIAAADPTPAAQDIPAGLPPDVMLPVLTVQSDLVSRFYAFRGFVRGAARNHSPSQSRARFLVRRRLPTALPGQWEPSRPGVSRRRSRRPGGRIQSATGGAC